MDKSGDLVATRGIQKAVPPEARDHRGGKGGHDPALLRAEASQREGLSIHGQISNGEGPHFSHGTFDVVTGSLDLPDFIVASIRHISA
jgi:hypothetical protein